jgi:glycosyltransferase involved in cell wall biosynthesis
MKIIALVRTLNEERNIARFCRSYAWADKILCADGGSTDKTVEIAQSFSNVEVRPFYERVLGENGTWRNPEGKHINFLINWAKEENCDWMTLEDCDCFPTKKLQDVGKLIFVEAEELGHKCVKLQRIYLYDMDKWFSRNKTNINWAWKPETNIYVDENDPWGIITLNVPETGYTLFPPLAVLHDFSPTPEIGQKKMDFYNKTGRMSVLPSIPEVFGELSPREEWMTDA